MAVSGARNSWLTMPRNSARNRSISSSEARSCKVTTTDSTAPSSERIAVELMRILTLRPSGTESTISSARTVSALLSCRASGDPARLTSRPSAHRNVATLSISSSGWPGMRRNSTMRRASRFSDTGWPVLASNTTTPTGDVSIRASTSARARRSAWWARAAAIAFAVSEAISTITSSSSAVNSGASSFSTRNRLPRLPTCGCQRSSAVWKVFHRIESEG